MSLTLTLLGPARAYCAAKGIPLSALSRAALGDWRRLPQLAAGECSITLASAERVLAYIAADWPADLDWPSDVPRPASSPDPCSGGGSPSPEAFSEGGPRAPP